MGDIVKTTDFGWHVDAARIKELNVNMQRARELQILNPAFADLAQRRLDGRPTEGYAEYSGVWEKGSWANALESHPSLNPELYQKLNISADKNKDGFVSKTEAMSLTSEDRNIVINALVDPKDPNFNFDIILDLNQSKKWLLG